MSFPGAVRSMGPARKKSQAIREAGRVEKVYERSNQPPLKLCYIWAVSVKKAEKREMDDGLKKLREGNKHLVH